MSAPLHRCAAVRERMGAARVLHGAPQGLHPRLVSGVLFALDRGTRLAVARSMPSTEQDRLDAETEKLRLESEKLRIELRRMQRPFWRQASLWRSLLASLAVGAGVYAAMSRAGVC